MSQKCHQQTSPRFTRCCRAKLVPSHVETTLLCQGNLSCVSNLAVLLCSSRCKRRPFSRCRYRSLSSLFSLSFATASSIAR
jgi:hypothetical protein